MEFITRNYYEIIALIMISATFKAVLIVREIVKEEKKEKPDESVKD